jgi:CENP-B N-terminal DNA-binding domain.
VTVPKRKHVVLTMKDKVNIVNRLKKHKRGKKLEEEYGVGTSTISDIKKSAEWVLKFASGLASVDGSSTRKMMRRTENDKAEDAVYI